MENKQPIENILKMDLTKIDESIYNKIIEKLKSASDLKYLKFHKKIVNDPNLEIIGIRTPFLRKIANYVALNDYEGFLTYNTHKTHEECVLHGLIIGYIKNKNTLIKMIDDFMPFNTNWAINDLTANKKLSKNIEFEKIRQYLKSDNPWEIRFGLTLLLHNINEKTVDNILSICDNVKKDHYYVKMANAWLLSYCYIEYPEKTFNYLQNCNLDKFTFTKTIGKICDSYRVGDIDKEKLKLLKKSKGG